MLTLLRWIARLLATAAAGLFIAFLVTGNAPDIRDLTDAELFGIGATGVMTVASGLSTKLVESPRPPRPTSSSTTSAGCFANR